jgi:hypothetical protein
MRIGFQFQLMQEAEPSMRGPILGCASTNCWGKRSTLEKLHPLNNAPTIISGQ